MQESGQLIEKRLVRDIVRDEIRYKGTLGLARNHRVRQVGKSDRSWTFSRQRREMCKWMVDPSVTALVQHFRLESTLVLRQKCRRIQILWTLYTYFREDTYRVLRLMWLISYLAFDIFGVSLVALNVSCTLIIWITYLKHVAPVRLFVMFVKTTPSSVLS